MMVGLLNMTHKIIAKVDVATSEKIIKEKSLINEIFKEFLFKSVFNSGTDTKNSTQQSMLDIIKA
jgi:hypothetical protein